MEGHIYKQTLLNVPATGSVDLTSLNNGVSGQGYASIEGLLPIPRGSVKSINTQDAAAEVQQLYTLGTSAPTIIAATVYGLMIGNTGTKVEGAQAQLKLVKTTSNAVLTGTAAFDRHNVYVNLAYKINHIASFNMVAFAIQTVPQGANNTAAFTPGTVALNWADGEIVTGSTSGATGRVLAGTTGSLTVGSINGLRFTTGEVLVGNASTPGGCSACGTVVTGVSLNMYDKAGYYKIDTPRTGANTVFVTDGFDPAILVKTTSAVYQVGQGAELLTWVYSQERTSGNRASGVYGFPTNQVPISTSTYKVIDITHEVPASASALSELSTGSRITQRIYASKASGSVANLITALGTI